MFAQAITARDVNLTVDELTALARRLRVVADDEPVPDDILQLLRRQYIATNEALRLRAAGATALTGRN